MKMKIIHRPSVGRDSETLTTYSHVRLIGTYYPSVYLRTGAEVIQPILETTQSTGVSTTDVTEIEVEDVPVLSRVVEPVFFFLYNTDNYFHFLYDALPTLSQYLRLPEPRPKLLMNPRHWYPYILDSLRLLGITYKDISHADSTTEYMKVIVASSPTHEGCSNEPPQDSIWAVYNQMRKSAGIPTRTWPKKVYISRRSWIHGDTSNMGTNYTTRRRLMCEDEFVEALKVNGYVEVFCEKLTMTEKIHLFAEATHVVGAIGGGMCNLVFSRPNCIVTCIASPDFERINHRFLYTMFHTNLTVFRDTVSTSMLYRRAKVGPNIGEIIAEDDETFTLALGNGTTWNQTDTSNELCVSKKECELLDQGLNSPWYFHVSDCMKLIQ
jgi:capsular polysaccharide biosynthesis protein